MIWRSPAPPLSPLSPSNFDRFPGSNFLDVSSFDSPVPRPSPPPDSLALWYSVDFDSHRRNSCIPPADPLPSPLPSLSHPCHPKYKRFTKSWAFDGRLPQSFPFRLFRCESWNLEYLRLYLFLLRVVHFAYLSYCTSLETTTAPWSCPSIPPNAKERSVLLCLIPASGNFPS